jgi:hypothetical protein
MNTSAILSNSSMYTEQAFIGEVQRSFATIKGKNSWAAKYFELEMPNNSTSVAANLSAKRCWQLYVASRDNSLGFLLLGEVSMRSKLALVQNFGLTSAHGHEDDEPWLSPWLGFDPKKGSGDPNLRKVDQATLDANANRHLQTLQGSGSILSDRLWTPLMNDAWLLGGVHKKQSFHLVTEGLGEQKLLAAMDSLRKPAIFEQRITAFGSLHGGTSPVARKIEAAWLQWFRDNPQYLYESWGPRVLTRELIGLMTFGYTPEFTRQELAFSCGNAALSASATIDAYSSALNTLGFHQGNDVAAKARVLKALSTWLFGQPDALQ